MVRAKKVGRPRKAKAAAKRSALSLRVRDILSKRLARTAKQNQRSISDEAVTRLEKSFSDDSYKVLVDAVDDFSDVLQILAKTVAAMNTAMATQISVQNAKRYSMADDPSLPELSLICRIAIAAFIGLETPNMLAPQTVEAVSVSEFASFIGGEPKLMAELLNFRRRVLGKQEPL